MQSRAGHRDLLLTHIQIRKRCTRGDVHLVLHYVDAGDLLRHRVLHLHARVHLNENVIAALIHEKLNRARALIVDLFAEIHRVLANALALLLSDVLRGRDLHNLLVAALHGTIALKQVHHVAVRIRENLHLNVLRIDHRALNVDIRIAECGLRFARSFRCEGLKVLSLFDEPHPPSATPRHGLHKHGELKVISESCQFFRVR